jgi:hypothetical protein
MQKKNSTPSEKEIGELLSTIQPKPSQRFYQKMADQPWSHTPRTWGHARQLAVLGGWVLLLVIILSLATPTFDALAQKLLQFFRPSSSNQTTVQVPLEDISDPDGRFNMTISEVETLAGFQVLEPMALPDDYVFSGANYQAEREAIVLNYTAESTGDLLRITQRLYGEEYQQIGAEAVVETVQISDVTGEYVSGAWTITEVKSSSKDHQPDSSATLEATWDPQAEIQILRWQNSEMLFEIIYAGKKPGAPGYLIKTDLIAIAESMH